MSLRKRTKKEVGTETSEQIPLCGVCSVLFCLLRFSKEQESESCFPVRSRVRGSFHSLLFIPLTLVADECSAAPGHVCDCRMHSLEKLSGDWKCSCPGKHQASGGPKACSERMPKAGVHSEGLWGLEREASCSRHLSPSCCQLYPCLEARQPPSPGFSAPHRSLCLAWES